MSTSSLRMIIQENGVTLVSRAEALEHKYSQFLEDFAFITQRNYDVADRTPGINDLTKPELSVKRGV